MSQNNNKIVLITGASRGIGRAAVKLLHAEAKNTTVLAGVRSTTAGEALLAELGDLKTNGNDAGVMTSWNFLRKF